MTEEKLGAKGLAPDWGKDYGIRDLWSEVFPLLWVGGTADGDTVLHARDGDETPRGLRVYDEPAVSTEDFDSLCTLYAWARPAGWGVLELRFGFPDAGLRRQEDVDTVREAAEWVAHQVRCGRRTLVRCQAGLNRSSLVAALAMQELGASPEASVAMIRRARSPQCLFNKSFARLALGKSWQGVGR